MLKGGDLSKMMFTLNPKLSKAYANLLKKNSSLIVVKPEVFFNHDSIFGQK